jgi:hypothetical protein
MGSQMKDNMINDSIGVASVEEDGTLKLVLHRNIETRSNFAMVLTIKPDNPRYRKYMNHIGYIPYGERKSIPAWTD